MEKEFNSKCNRRDFVKRVGVMGTGLVLIPSLFGCGSQTATESGTEKEPSKPAEPAKNPVKMAWAISEVQTSQKYHELGVWEFAKRIQDKSNGEIVVDIFQGGQLGSQPEALEKVRMSQIQASQSSSQNAAQFIPEFNLMDLPYLIKTAEDWKKLLSTGVIEETMNQAAIKNGFKVLYYAPAGWRNLFIAKKAKIDEVHGPDDIKGLKIRTTASIPEQRAFQLCGAASTPVAWGECYTALQQGVVDGLNVGAAPIYVNKIHEVCKLVAEINFMISMDMNLCSLKWYNGLPSDYQKLIDETCQEIVEWHLDLQFNKQLPAVMQNIADEGCKVYIPTAQELDLWANRIGHELPVWDDLKEKWGKETYEKMVKTVS